jgi:hypothetical protein
VRRQADLLWNTSFVCIVLVCAIHISLAVSTLPFWSVGRHVTAASAEPMLGWQILNAALISIAITALGARALEQGFQPEREKEHYRQCKSAVEDVPRQVCSYKVSHPKAFDHVRNGARFISRDAGFPDLRR